MRWRIGQLMALHRQLERKVPVALLDPQQQDLLGPEVVEMQDRYWKTSP